ncbi:MAG: exonuclease SbcCD subunit D [Clostridia bacterium]|nr:exonuclease SbcCD subunit D [Clostridia bacterium]
MKLMHLSDLHIGKRLNDFSLLEDQKYIFTQMMAVMDREQPDAVLIAGDVYDRSVPSSEAMALLDDLLNDLADRGKPVLIISGNHDSAERLTFAGRFMERCSIHVSPVYDGHIEPVVLSDEYGEVKIWLMPYVCPDNAARFFPGESIRNADDAAAAVIGAMGVNPAERNVIVAHQFIAGGTTSDSERRNIGTLEDVRAELFDAFDYVALGHLHRPQDIGRKDGTMRYSGTPLMYSRSELGCEKTLTFTELGPKGSVSVYTVPLQPVHRIHIARGLFDELMQGGPENGAEDDYYYIDLTDEDDIPNAAARLRERFPRLLAMRYDNRRTRFFAAVDAPEEAEQKQPLELLAELYRLVHQDAEMSEEAAGFVRETMKKVEGMQS